VKALFQTVLPVIVLPFALAACGGSKAGQAIPQSAAFGQAERAPMPAATATPDTRSLARYSSQLALGVLSTEGVNLGLIGELLSPPSGCTNDQTFSVSAATVTVSTYPGNACQGSAEEVVAYSISAQNPFSSSFSANAPANGKNYTSTGYLSTSANSLPLTHTYEIGQPTWQSPDPKNAQRGISLTIEGSGTIGGSLKVTGGSGTYAKAFDGTKAVLASAVAKATKTGLKVTVKGSLYESTSQTITIAPVSSEWTVSGGTIVKGASVKATFLGANDQGDGGTFTYAYKNPKDPDYAQLDGTVTAKIKKVFVNGIGTVALVQGKTTEATLVFDQNGYGTITYFNGSVEYITDWTVHEGS
jgi:hypothetical protein